MNNVVKKLAIYSMVGAIQIGFGASVIEASPLHNNVPPMQQQYNQHDNRGNNPHERDRNELERRERAENERHEQEMKRHPHETKKQWHKRQQQEKERHDRILREIREHR